jgi:hypothetical protein
MTSQHIQTALTRYFRHDRRIVAAYLFGSHARGSAGPESDVDIALLLRSDIPRARYADLRLRYTCALLKALRTDRVDLLLLNAAGPLAKHQVYSKGKLVFCRDARRTLRAKDLASSEYLDFLPFRRRAEEDVLRRLHAGGRHG